MKALSVRATGQLTVSWRTIEWWGAGICLFLQTGALFPLLLADPNGDLGDAARAKLRFVSLPIYAFSILILSRHSRQFLVALKRNLLIHFLFAMPFVSVLWSVSPGTTLRRANGLLFAVLLAYVLALRFTPRQLLLLLMMTLGACIVPSLLLLGISPGLARMPLDGALRGIFIHKNTLGWYASVLTLISFIVLTNGSYGHRRSAIALLIASIACLIGSTSMTSIIATASACCLTWFYTVLPKTRGIGRAAFVMLFVQMAAVLLILLHEFLVPVLEALGKDATLTGRVPLWELVDAEIGRHLLLGFGYQAFWTEANPEAWSIWSQIQWMAPHAHNGFRDTLLSFGIGGMCLFMLVVIRAAYQGAVLQCRAPEDGWLWLNVFMVMVMVMNLTESIFLVQNDTIFVLFATAIILFSLYSPVYAKKPAPHAGYASLPAGLQIR